jgi:hypothetical protein
MKKVYKILQVLLYPGLVYIYAYHKKLASIEEIAGIFSKSKSFNTSTMPERLILGFHEIYIVQVQTYCVTDLHVNYYERDKNCSSVG